MSHAQRRDVCDTALSPLSTDKRARGRRHQSLTVFALSSADLGTGKIMSDTRKTERVRSLLRGQVIFNKGSSTFDCVVRNISTAGARLEIADSMALPAEFDLDIPHKGKSFRARIVWRADNLVGVEMVDARAATPVASADETDADRCDRLMRENAKLKAQILELRQRVAQLSEAA